MLTNIIWPYNVMMKCTTPDNCSSLTKVIKHKIVKNLDDINFLIYMYIYVTGLLKLLFEGSMLLLKIFLTVVLRCREGSLEE